MDISFFIDKAVETAKSSPHLTNKIGACLWHDDDPKTYVAYHNQWPKAIANKIGTDSKIGNSSGTIHAETACIVKADFETQGASIAITDPFCPNCAKNMAEAGLQNIYIDEAGFDGDFFKRRGDHFDTMSMQICEQAGINVYGYHSKTKEKRTIYEAPASYVPPVDDPIKPLKIDKPDEDTFQKIIQDGIQRHQRRKFSIALVQDINGHYFGLTVRAHAVIGFSLQQDSEALELLTPIGKYSFIQEPVNRMLMHCARMGYHILDDKFFCSQVPTSREQVNLVGAGIKRITIGNRQKSRDKHGFDAMKQLSEADIVHYD